MVEETAIKSRGSDRAEQFIVDEPARGLVREGKKALNCYDENRSSNVVRRRKKRSRSNRSRCARLACLNSITRFQYCH